MTYIAEDGTEYKYKSDYWKTLYPMREKKTIDDYSRRITNELFPEYYEKIRKSSREHMKHKYHTDEKYKEYQKSKALKHFYKYRTAIKDNFFLNP